MWWRDPWDFLLGRSYLSSWRLSLWLLKSVDSESCINHWKFFIIFTEVTIVLVIINIIEKGDQLRNSFTILRSTDISEVLDIERDSSYLRQRVIQWGSNTALQAFCGISCNNADLAAWLIDHRSSQDESHLWVCLLSWHESADQCPILVDVVSDVLWVHILCEFVLWI